MSARKHPSLHADLAAVAERLRTAVRLERAGASDRFTRGFRADNVVLALPFLLTDGLTFVGARDAAREMAFANAAGAAHFLLQDDEIDGDAAPSPDRSSLSDSLLMLFTRSYSRLVGDTPAFWQHVERYLGEYAAALLWERDVLRSPDGGRDVTAKALPTTLRRLGRRLALLKTTCAAVAHLAGMPDRLASAEEAVDRFHAGYQLADDLEDLRDDLAAGRWSVPAWLLSNAMGLATPGGIEPGAAEEDLAASGVSKRVLALIDAEYRAASAAAGSGGFGALAAFFAHLGHRAVIGGAWTGRRTALSAALTGRSCGGERQTGQPLHGFSVFGEGFLYDIGSGLFLEADPIAAELQREGFDGPALDAARLNYGPAADEAARELTNLSRCVAPPLPDEGWPPDVGADMLAPVTALSLHVTSACNLRCGYCYHGTGGSRTAMTVDTARRAVDLLMAESFGSRRVSVVFFGGEPLLEPDLVLETASYARRRGRDAGRRVDLHMTTNGTLLTETLASRLRDAGVNVMVSLDGPEKAHDRSRRYPDGRGSFSSIRKNLGTLPPGMRVAARATVVPGFASLEGIVDGILGLGVFSVHLAPVSGLPFDDAFAERLVEGFESLARRERERVRAGRPVRIGNFHEVMSALHRGMPRLAPCGAGSRYFSVRPDGCIVVCHRFANDASYAVGDVGRGIDRRAAGSHMEELRPLAAGCTSCWARFLCGGPCLHDARCSPGRTTGPTSPWCRVTRRVLELSMWIYAGMSEARRTELFEDARRPDGPREVESTVHGGRW